MANELTPSDVRRNMAKDRSGDGISDTGNGNSRRGTPRKQLNLRDKRQVPDEVLQKIINRSKREVADDTGLFSVTDNDTAMKAVKYLTFLSVSLQSEGREAPRSVSHARRYSFEDQQHKFWRDRMVRALNQL